MPDRVRPRAVLAAAWAALAAQDPYGWYRPASTLKVLTAVARARR